METFLYIVLGASVGGAIAWFAAGTRRSALFAGRLAEAEARGKSAEAIAGELRRELDQKGAEISRLRSELDGERRGRIESATRLEAARSSLEEERLLFGSVKKEMSDTFSALSSAALKNSNEEFLRLASEKLSGISAETKGRLGEHQAAIDGMIKPLHDMLGRYEEQLRAIEESRHRAYGGLVEQIKTLTSTHESLQKETSNLVTALRKPQVRGRWGEIQLKRVAELSGMSGHCDFTEQKSVETDSGRLRPDMVVHLPADRLIVVDSKVPLDAYLDAISTADPEEAKSRLTRHAAQVRAHINKLASKEYWSQFAESPELVVLFIPAESFWSAALEADRTLMEDGIEKKVIVATPATFVALLKAIAYGWRQEQAARNAREIIDLGKDLYERIGVLTRHFKELGASIGKVVDGYNEAVGSMESRVLPIGRKFRDLGVTGAGEIPALEKIDQSPRPLQQPEIKE